MVNRAKPIPEVLNDERTSPTVKKILGEVGAVKAYADRFGLKPTKNYEDYVHWDGEAASWVVTACQPTRFEVKTWSFPVVGSFNYLGWFDRKDADAHAEKLRAEGWDVDVRGASAYSTLGWFRDPILSTMMPSKEVGIGFLVNTVLHESIHATLYVAGQSYFNESLASFGADEMTPVYLKARYGAESEELKFYLDGMKKAESRNQKFQKAYHDLSAIYSSADGESIKIEKKKKIIDELQEQVKFSRSINNATLVGFRTYGLGQAEFENVFESCGRDWNRFWDGLRKLSAKDFEKPQWEDFGSMLLKKGKGICQS